MKANKLKVTEEYLLVHLQRSGISPTSLETSLCFQTRNYGDGLSVVAPIYNSSVDNLIETLSNWISFPEISEIVLVAWNTELSVSQFLDSKYGVIELNKLSVLTVTSEKEYQLSSALNLGVQHATQNKVLTLSTETKLESDFFRKHSLDEGWFFSRKYDEINSEDSQLKGIVYAFRKDLVAVNGYDPRYNVESPEDIDLYTRLKSSGVQPKSLETEYLIINSESVFSQTKKQVSRNLLTINQNSNVEPWGVWNSNFSTTSIILQKEPRLTTNQVSLRECQIKYIEKEDREQNFVFYSPNPDLTELRNSLNRSSPYGPHHSIILSWTREKLLSQLELFPVEPKIQVGRPYQIITDQLTRWIVLKVENGLANRLRALASGLYLAILFNKPLRVIWVADSHVNATFGELFDQRHFENELAKIRVQVVSDFNEYEIQPSHFDIYDYSIESEFNKTILNNLNKNIFIRSSFSLSYEHFSLVHENQFLKNLRLTSDIENMISETDNYIRGQISEFVETPVYSSLIGVHIRNRRYLDEPIDPSNYSETHLASDYKYRGMCNETAFRSYITDALNRNPNQRFYISSDNASLVYILKEEFPNNIFFQSNFDCIDRTLNCLKHSLVDLMILGRTKYVVGSFWSSFSEIASRLSHNDHEYFGCGETSNCPSNGLTLVTYVPEFSDSQSRKEYTRNLERNANNQMVTTMIILQQKTERFDIFDHCKKVHYVSLGQQDSSKKGLSWKQVFSFINEKLKSHFVLFQSAGIVLNDGLNELVSDDLSEREMFALSSWGDRMHRDDPCVDVCPKYGMSEEMFIHDSWLFRAPLPERVFENKDFDRPLQTVEVQHLLIHELKKEGWKVSNPCNQFKVYGNVCDLKLSDPKLYEQCGKEKFCGDGSVYPSFI